MIEIDESGDKFDFVMMLWWLECEVVAVTDLPEMRFQLLGHSN